MYSWVGERWSARSVAGVVLREWVVGPEHEEQEWSIVQADLAVEA